MKRVQKGKTKEAKAIPKTQDRHWRMGGRGGQGSKTEQSENTAGTPMASASNRPVRSFKGAALVGAEIKGVGAGGNGRVRKSGLGRTLPVTA